VTPAAADAVAAWERAAERFMAVRSDAGVALVRDWARRTLAPGAAILDIGCGSGVPVARALAADGFRIAGVDASPTMVGAFRRNVPGAAVACGRAEDGAPFEQYFGGAIAVGLVFLLAEREQRRVLRAMADALEPGVRLLFSALAEACSWADTLTGLPSLSPGADAYAAWLGEAGLRLAGRAVDEGGNSYFDASKPG
jgi:SAM-dependent methyltransferase